MPWMPGIRWPSSACSTSLSGTSTAAPITGPHSVPAPPNNDRIIAWADVTSPNTLEGVTTSRITAYSPPAPAAMAPLTVSASSFQRSVSTPAASAASSFCLIASSDMPKRDRSIANEITSAAASSPSAIAR